MVLVVGLMVTSCSEDTTVTEESVEEFGRSKDSNQGDQKSKNVAAINNQIVNDWTDLMLELERYAGGMRPNASARALAYIHLATYETAVPGMKNHVSNTSRLEGFKISRQEIPRNVNWESALNAC